MDGNFELFLQAWDDSEKVIILTGAGVSTLSGIPDFRGKNGFYSGGKLWNGYDKEDLFDIDFFHAHPDVFYQFAREYLYLMLDKTPSIVHRTLSALQKTGKVDFIYTQNIDALHCKAGSVEVGELHGTLQFLKCPKCCERTDIEKYRPRIDSGCIPLCSCGSVLKPDVVFFGEPLDETLLDKAVFDCENADMIWVLGSSLTVQPAASLPLFTKHNGGKVVIVNADDTPLDYRADFRFYDLEKFCRRAAEAGNLNPVCKK